MVVSVSIGIVGPGIVGATVIRQVLSQAPYLESVLGAVIRIVGISNSKRMLMCPDGIESDRMIWEQKLLEVGSLPPVVDDVDQQRIKHTHTHTHL